MMQRIENSQRETRLTWMIKLRTAAERIRAIVPPGGAFILVDDNQCPLRGGTAGRRLIPFLEHQGQYWGSPPDDRTAILEFNRLRKEDPAVILFAWPAFWWLRHYPEFSHYLRSHFRCVLEDDDLIAFDLRR